MTVASPPAHMDPERIFAHRPRLMRSALSLCKSHDAAEDLVQDTFERILRAPRSVTGPEVAYLLRTLRNTHVDGVRAAARRPQTASLPEGLDPADPRAEPAPADEARGVLTALAELPHPFRDAVVAVDLWGCSYDEAARILRVPRGTVQSRASRGRDRVARAVHAEACD